MIQQIFKCQTYLCQVVDKQRIKAFHETKVQHPGAWNGHITGTHLLTEVECIFWQNYRCSAACSCMSFLLNFLRAWSPVVGCKLGAGFSHLIHQNVTACNTAHPASHRDLAMFLNCLLRICIALPTFGLWFTTSSTACDWPPHVARRVTLQNFPFTFHAVLWSTKTETKYWCTCGLQEKYVLT